MSAEAREEQAYAVMGRMYQLALDALRAESIEALGFDIVNRTVELVPYRRAALWQLGGPAPRLLAVSGAARPEPRSELVEQWGRLVARLGPPAPDGALAGAVLDAPEWRAVVGAAGASGGGPEGRAVVGAASASPGAPPAAPGAEAVVLWLGVTPEPAEAGLWLERAPGAPFGAGERALLHALMRGYGLAWQRLRPAAPAARRWRGPVAALVLLALLVFPRCALRLVAPCEVVPGDPHVITAPLAGVVEAISVTPGQAVEAGAELFRYDARVAEEELEVARQQVEIAQSRLDRALVRTLDRETPGEGQLAILRNQLAQERARLHLAERTASKLVVRAPVAGVAQIADPQRWRGRPVQVGERVLTLIDPARTRLRLWIAEADRVGGLDGTELACYLHVEPERGHTARLAYVASEAAAGPDGATRFLAEADWVGASCPPGLHGVAVLRAAPVSPLYALLRKPWIRVRQLLGS